MEGPASGGDRQVSTGRYQQGETDPSITESVYFYKNKAGLPGKLVAACDFIHGVENRGSFVIRIPKTCKVVLDGGTTYWVSVFASVDFLYGDWGWETRNSKNGKPAAWENPKGGFGPCRTWDVMTSCIGDYGEGPDFMFTLKGKDIAQ